MKTYCVSKAYRDESTTGFLQDVESRLFVTLAEAEDFVTRDFDTVRAENADLKDDLCNIVRNANGTVDYASCSDGNEFEVMWTVAVLDVPGAGCLVELARGFLDALDDEMDHGDYHCPDAVPCKFEDEGNAYWRNHHELVEAASNARRAFDEALEAACGKGGGE